MGAVSEQALQERVNRLEGFATWLLAVAALVPLLVGWVSPWYVEEHRDHSTDRVRLATQGFEVFAPSEGTELDTFGWLVGVGFLFLDVATVATVVMLIRIGRRSWRSMRLGAWIVRLTLVCLFVVIVLSLVTATADRTSLHVLGPFLWGSGVVLSAVFFFSSTSRAWWSYADWPLPADP